MFRIGEFARIAQVSGRLLRYYDEIGLLSPEYVDAQTGYRYYTAEQLPRLNRILALKDLGFTLDQIAGLLDDNISPDEIRGMLTMKKAQIQQSLREEISRLYQVEVRLAQIEREGQSWERDIVIKRVPSSPYLFVRGKGPLEQIFTDLVDDIYRALPANSQSSSFGHLVNVLHSPLCEQEPVDMELGFLMNQPHNTAVSLPSGRALAVRELAGVNTMATAVAQGWQEGLATYNALGNWIAANGFQLVGPIREVLFTLQPLDDMANSLLEVQFPIIPSSV